MLKNGRPYSIENGYIDSKLLENEPKEIRDCVIEWIHDYIWPRKTPLHNNTSYGIKHILQNDTGIYLTNNQFKDAMMICGFDPVDPNALNWVYRISKRSPIFRPDFAGRRFVALTQQEIYEVYETARKKAIQKQQS